MFLSLSPLRTLGIVSALFQFWISKSIILGLISSFVLGHVWNNPICSFFSKSIKIVIGIPNICSFHYVGGWTQGTSIFSSGISQEEQLLSCLVIWHSDQLLKHIIANYLFFNGLFSMEYSLYLHRWGHRFCDYSILIFLQRLWFEANAVFFFINEITD
jgi:hypothetical protein